MGLFRRKPPLTEEKLKHNILTYSMTGERQSFEEYTHEYLSRFGKTADLSKPLSETDQRTLMRCAIMAGSKRSIKRLKQLGAKPTEEDRSNAALIPSLSKLLEGTD